MSHFLIYTEDKPDSLHIRQENRDAHLAWVQKGPDVKLVSGGPWVDEDDVMRGSLLIVEAGSLKTVEDWLENDPYGKAGLTGFKRVRAYKWLLGAPD